MAFAHTHHCVVVIGKHALCAAVPHCDHLVLGDGHSGVVSKLTLLSHLLELRRAITDHISGVVLGRLRRLRHQLLPIGRLLNVVVLATT